MSFSFEIYLIFAAALLYICFLMILYLLVYRYRNLDRNERLKNSTGNFSSIIEGNAVKKNKLNGFDKKAYCYVYKRTGENLILDEKRKTYADRFLFMEYVEKQGIKGIKSRLKRRRMEACIDLNMAGSEKSRLALEEALIKEMDFPVKLYIANAVADFTAASSIPLLVESLLNAHRWYRKRVNMLICEFGKDFLDYLPVIKNRSEMEIKELIVDFSAVYFADELKEYLIKLINAQEYIVNKYRYDYMDMLKKSCGICKFGRKTLENKNRICPYKGEVTPFYSCSKFEMLPIAISGNDARRQLSYEACRVLARYYPDELKKEEYLNCKDPVIRNISIEALKFDTSFDNIIALIRFLHDPETEKTAITVIKDIVSQKPEYLMRIAELYESGENEKIKTQLAVILSGRIEYFFTRLLTRDRSLAKAIIEDALKAGSISGAIDFINRNKDKNLEREIVKILDGLCGTNEGFADNFCNYLDIKFLDKYNKGHIKQEKTDRKAAMRDSSLINNVYIITVFAILLFPLIYFFRNYDILFLKPFMVHLRGYVRDFNYYLLFYSVLINVIYLILLLLSAFNIKKQSELFELKNKRFLFKNRMLPGISIIAPAFNEEQNILESTNSLLNLIYPDYELIIVNDGSKDTTLDVLIKAFDLRKTDFGFDERIKTKPVIAIYTNPSLPKLILVDKVNGGKADSLNAGINISRKEYFCGIDADSLLEPESLLKIASMQLDSGVEIPACGGNVFPVNGCIVDRGIVEEYHIPENNLARLQTIEYIRSFMAGRLGWAYSNNLLIISGAFGLFRKERVVDVGGYLTGSGRFNKDTVGEDMELVVRIARNMREKRLKHKIEYMFNANCWTEVPEDFKSLKRQRYRWHRGLLEILNFHKKMMFNPSYKSVGLISLPYFFIFETVGPLIEVQGYLMVILAYFLGILNAQIALLLFIATVLMGMVVSLSSIIISEKDSKYVKTRDIGILIIFAIVENFGIRQFFSFLRVGATLNMLRSKKNQEWGKADRKGFKK